MDEKELKTSTKQRVLIGVVAVVLLGSIIAGYAAIVANNGKSNASGADVDPGKLARYEEEYEAEVEEFKAGTQADFQKFLPYRSEVVAYNEAAANEGGVTTRDLVVGDGKELAEGDKDYYAYYIGWCADETVFDSSFDSSSNPTGFARALDPSGGLMIEGWETGVVGMKLGGIREITMPGELAYKDTQEICGGMNKPLKFLVMAVAKDEPLKTLEAELEDKTYKYQMYALYGIDYEEIMTEATDSDETTETEAGDAADAGTDTTDVTDAAGGEEGQGE